MADQTPHSHGLFGAITTSHFKVKSTMNKLRYRRSWHIAGVVGLTIVVGLFVTLFMPLKMALAAALTTFCIGLWATAAVPEYWPAFAFFLVAMLFELAPEQTVFSGFHSSTFWLLLSGIVLGASIRFTGLGQRTAALLSKMLGKRYSTVIFGIIGFSLALSFVMPSSMGRIVLLLPIIAALAEHMDYGAGSNGQIGMVTAAAFGSNLPAYTILPANGPNMMLAGMAESVYGYEMTYWNYLLLHFPVLGILKALVLGILVLWMFPEKAPANHASDQFKLAPMTSAERRLSMVLLICLTLWLTDSIHHISSGWVGLAAALYALWPDSNLTSKKCLNEEINYGALFFVAGIMGLGAVISATGLGAIVVQNLSQHIAFAPGQPYWNLGALTGIATIVAIMTNVASVPAIMTPIAEQMANLTGLPLVVVLMTQVLAFSNILLPYQAPPIVTAIQIGRLPTGAIARLCLILFFISLFVLTPLEVAWWHLLGLV